MEKRIAAYIRLSLEDVDLRTNRSKDESNSVGNQRLLIQNYIVQQKDLSTLPVMFFCDDGYTGTNFERPQFQNMIDLAKDGKISCVIVKDLSRFGRNYLEVGDYLEHIFPFLGVRFIAINDNFDSNDYIGITSGIDIAFKNLIAQKYSEDLSDKVKSSMRMKMAKGEYVNHPPFGYQKSPENKHKIIPDPETAPIVREIFEAILSGYSTSEIATRFNERQVLTPMAYKKWRDRKELVGRTQIWNHRSILRIIKDLKYTGAMVNHKCENRHIRDKSQRRIPEEEWIVTEDMHEGIVTKEEFELANKAIRNVAKCQKKSPNKTDRVFYCGHCGRKLRKSCNTKDYFACETAVYHPGVDCGEYRWGAEELELLLFEAYKVQLLLLERKLKEVKKERKKEAPCNFISKIRQFEKALESCKAEKLFQYEAYRAGRIDKEGFINHKAMLEEKMRHLEEQKTEVENQRIEYDRVLSEKNLTLKTLTEITERVDAPDADLRTQMYEDIDRVLVFSNKEIEIQWKFADLFTTGGESKSEQFVK